MVHQIAAGCAVFVNTGGVCQNAEILVVPLCTFFFFCSATSSYVSKQQTRRCVYVHNSSPSQSRIQISNEVEQLSGC